jgi:16S rRNA (guanine527-N7)-methyltransferase
VDENQRQNLTRLTEPGPFFSGHVLDVVELRKARTSWGESTGAKWIDLGSGAGVPGLLSAALFQDERWVLVEAERRKAEFLERAAAELGLGARVRVIHARMEKIREDLGAEAVASKAVGPVGRLYPWLKESSTWNSLVLFKGPRWAEEWAEFKKGPEANELEASNEWRYSTPEGASRLIIQLRRVSRGTSIRPKRS